jgi:hypothetical protein
MADGEHSGDGGREPRGDRAAALGGGGAAPSSTTGGAPGQRTLTQRASGRGDPASRWQGDADGAGDAVAADSLCLVAATDDAGSRVPPRVADAAGQLGLGDVSGVRVHADADAAARASHVGARAFAIGQDVYFGAGEYQPGTERGDALIGHELAHTVQQRGAPSVQAKSRLDDAPVNGAGSLEHEADAVGGALVAALHLGEISPVGALTAVTTPQVARDAGDAEANAYIKLVGYTRDGEVVRWSGLTTYSGSLPKVMRGDRTSGAWSWDDPTGATLMVNTPSMQPSKEGGEPIRAWASTHHVVRITVVISERTVDLVDDDAKGGLGENFQAGSGEQPDSGIRREDREEDRPPGHELTTELGKPAGGDGTGAAELELDFTVDPEAEAARRLAEFETELGIEGPGEGDGELDGDADGEDERTRDGTGEGEIETDNEYEGTADDPGYRQGEKTQYQRGVRHGGKDGQEGGEGRPEQRGVRGGNEGFALIKTVPASIRGAVELGLILEEGYSFASGFGAFKGPAKMALKNAAKRGAKDGVEVSIRRSLALEAKEVSQRELKRVRSELAKMPEWKVLTAEERMQTLRYLYWNMQREFFDGVEAAAAAELRDLGKKLKKLQKKKGKKAAAKRRAVEAEIQEAETIGRAVEVKPVAGRLPINHKYAGKEFPREKLPTRFREKGMRFTAEGYPDFLPYAKDLPNGSKTFKMTFTGSRSADEQAANAALGFRRTPPGYTWHHMENMSEMILVPTDLHRAVSHTGGTAAYKGATGVAEYLP